MSLLMRASEIHARPVVTMGGEDVAQVKDIVYSPGGGEVHGFTLAGRGMLAGPLDRGIRWSDVHALGGDALMVADEEALQPLDVLLGDAGGGDGHGGGDILGSQVLTDDGTVLGKVVDVIVGVLDSSRGAGHCDVVGYEIEASDAVAPQGGTMLVPLPDTLAASAEHLMVPASARDFVRHDMAGFGAAVEEFRSQLEGRQ
ncbi:PRC-barrel domain-containing protein [Nocardioides sp. GCM10027113]|uniref:PRC-barrel domain-containing protein n=1 Tax=unclassified Nocardioides TaxID=2615069 RepID=UPI00361B5093